VRRELVRTVTMIGRQTKTVRTLNSSETATQLRDPSPPYQQLQRVCHDCLRVAVPRGHRRCDHVHALLTSTSYKYAQTRKRTVKFV